MAAVLTISTETSSLLMFAPIIILELHKVNRHRLTNNVRLLFNTSLDGIWGENVHVTLLDIGHS